MLSKVLDRLTCECTLHVLIQTPQPVGRIACGRVHPPLARTSTCHGYTLIIAVSIQEHTNTIE